MYNFSDANLFECRLKDEKGDEKNYLGRIRNWEFLKGWNDIIDRRGKAIEEKDTTATNACLYEMVAFLFSVPVAEMRKYSIEMLENIVRSYTGFCTKKTAAQENTEK